MFAIFGMAERRGLETRLARSGMARSRIKNFKSRDLPPPGELSSVLIRLMVAVNDIALAADASDMWEATDEQRRAWRKQHARMYFVRLIMSHVHEALHIIKDINKSADLRAAVDKCNARTQKNFGELIAIRDTPERGQLARFRTKVTFHYDKVLSGEHLQKMIAEHPAASWSFSLGSTPLDWHFELGDAVMDRMVVKFVLGADEPRSPARSKKVGEFATRLDQIGSQFTDFATSFIERHCK